MQETPAAKVQTALQCLHLQQQKASQSSLLTGHVQGEGCTGRAAPCLLVV